MLNRFCPQRDRRLVPKTLCFVSLVAYFFGVQCRQGELGAPGVEHESGMSELLECLFGTEQPSDEACIAGISSSMSQFGEADDIGFQISFFGEEAGLV